MFFSKHSADALDILCAQLTRDLFAIAKFLVSCAASEYTGDKIG